MGLILSGKLFSRTSKPYTMKDRDTGDVISGVSHRAKVGLGRGESVDVKVNPEQFTENGGIVPPTDQIPEDGVDVAWEVSAGFGKLTLVGIAPGSARALRPAASS